jgi:Sel1 repeat
MAKRPTHIDIPPANLDPLSRPLYAPHDNLLSSRNDVPPALSPLDAIAMQSRMLAKRFEEENSGGRRISRLPAGTVATEFAKSRPDFFRSMTTGSHMMHSHSRMQEEEAAAKNAVEVQNVPNAQRPVSHYPQMVLTDSIFGLGKTFSFQSQLNTVEENSRVSKQEGSPYSFPRSHSPEDMETPAGNGINISPPLPPATSSLPNMSPQKLSIGPSLLSPSPSSSIQNLAQAPTIRAVPVEFLSDASSDTVDDALQNLSLEKPNPPFQKELSVLRSPSLNSVRSVSSSINRPSMNYSRPISRQSRPSMDSKTLGESPYQALSGQFSGSRLPLDLVYRQDSADTNVSPFSNDAPQTPTSLASEDLFSSPEAKSDSTPASYVYTKYALGNKLAKRESVGLEEFINRQFNWEPSNPDAQMAFTLPRPIVLSHSPPSPALTSSPRFARRKDRPSDIVIPSSVRPSSEGSPAARRRLRKSRPGTPTTLPSEASTIKGVGVYTSKSSSIKELSPDEHLQRGIELHEEGNLQKSTYHLRLASKAGHPTAMVLYALACRHGWGMKPNASEGVAWLQKAVDSAQLEVAEDEDLIKHGHAPDSTERKTHKAQFALGVYELGVSYMKGWGVTQDRALGLRCFEIAGSWGDADALAEAGHCYLEGIGCKKDLKKSAKFYRLAESKGVQVAGNSW